jgi:hypothetical protein
MSLQVAATLSALRTQVRTSLAVAFPGEVAEDPPDVLITGPGTGKSAQLHVGVRANRVRPLDGRRNPSPDDPVEEALLEATVEVVAMLKRQPADRGVSSSQHSYDTALDLASGVLARLCADADIQLVDASASVVYVDSWWQVTVSARVAQHLRVIA